MFSDEQGTPKKEKEAAKVVCNHLFFFFFFFPYNIPPCFLRRSIVFTQYIFFFTLLFFRPFRPLAPIFGMDFFFFFPFAPSMS